MGSRRQDIGPAVHSKGGKASRKLTSSLGSKSANARTRLTLAHWHGFLVGWKDFLLCPIAQWRPSRVRDIPLTFKKPLQDWLKSQGLVSTDEKRESSSTLRSAGATFGRFADDNLLLSPTSPRTAHERLATHRSVFSM
ncbi:hypothetical protein PV05_04507 [Exophiala xenobiotica]|uniref:Uncharacterized protein n=1 Tax=Exophiala xenobiotica TaxID=348802 RepID=A0A0D2D060_9EURO|nr:uncharacterized protein PV05_04507 [Exophiala xenobiotica]KIW55782.1 hypothetical protein PV05_04507 [Exophiala xenobiotica]